MSSAIRSARSFFGGSFPSLCRLCSLAFKLHPRLIQSERLKPSPFAQAFQVRKSWASIRIVSEIFCMSLYCQYSPFSFFPSGLKITERRSNVRLRACNMDSAKFKGCTALVGVT
jgi:hypothetical protein